MFYHTAETRYLLFIIDATTISYSATNVTTPIINSVYCPRNAQHWSNCTFNTTTTRPCIDHKNDMYLICLKSKSIHHLIN